MVTYTLAQTPVAPVRRVDGASEEARIFAEICERLLEIEGEKFGEAKALVRRLATLADISERGFLLVLRFGAGDTGAELLRLVAELRVGQRRHLGLQGIDGLHHTPVLLQQTVVTTTKKRLQDALDHGDFQ